MLRWVALALAGLLVAVAVAYAASRLASPHVGLTSEPVSAGAKLAPAPAPRPAPRRRHPPAPTTTVTVPAPAPPSGDDGGPDD
jgi:hypothetical protein